MLTITKFIKFTPAVHNQLSSWPKHRIVSVKFVSNLKYSLPLAVDALIYVPPEKKILVLSLKLFPVSSTQEISFERGCVLNPTEIDPF